jgi:hypothetical protein
MGAKSLCIPFEQPTGEHAIVLGTTKCTQCGENAKVPIELYLYNLFLAYIDYLNSITHFLEDPTSFEVSSILIFCFWSKIQSSISLLFVRN